MSPAPSRATVCASANIDASHGRLVCHLDWYVTLAGLTGQSLTDGAEPSQADELRKASRQQENRRYGRGNSAETSSILNQARLKRGTT